MLRAKHKALVVSLLAWTAVAASAQTFRGAISGAVADTSGAAVPAATIALTSPTTGLARTTLSSQTGEFSLPDLPLGFYNLTVNKDGFQVVKVDGVEVSVSKITNLNLKLSVSQQSAVVEVSAESASLETTTSALTGVVGPKIVA